MDCQVEYRLKSNTSTDQLHLSIQVGQHQPVHADGAPRVDAEEAGEGAGGDEPAAESGRKVGKNLYNLGKEPTSYAHISLFRAPQVSS